MIRWAIEGYVPASTISEIESPGQEHPRGKAHPLFADLRPELPRPVTRCLEDGHAVHNYPGQLQRSGRRAHPEVLKALLPDPPAFGPAPRARPTSAVSSQFAASDGKENQHIYKRLRPSGVLQRVFSALQAISYTTGVLAAACTDAADLLSAEPPRARTPWKSFIRTRIWTLWTSTARPARRATPRLSGIDAVTDTCLPFAGLANF